MDNVQLSLIVPILNEREHLPDFLANLARQKSIDFELIICDGGSSDGSFEWLQQQHPDWTNLKIQRGESGPRRGGGGKGHCIVLFPFPVRRLWQNDHFVARKSTAYVDLGTPDNDTLLVLFHHF